MRNHSTTPNVVTMRKGSMWSTRWIPRGARAKSSKPSVSPKHFRKVCPPPTWQLREVMIIESKGWPRASTRSFAPFLFSRGIGTLMRQYQIASGTKLSTMGVRTVGPPPSLLRIHYVTCHTMLERTRERTNEHELSSDRANERTSERTSSFLQPHTPTYIHENSSSVPTRCRGGSSANGCQRRCSSTTYRPMAC